MAGSRVTTASCQTNYYYNYNPLGLVAQSVMSATDMVGHRDVHGLSGIDPCSRQWISVHTKPKYVGIPSQLVFVTTPHMSVCGDNTVQYLLLKPV